MPHDNEIPRWSYINGGTEVQIFKDGTKKRTVFDVSVPPVHPEQADCKITNWCDAACAYCHEGSTKRGKPGDVDAIIRLFSDLPAGFEVAIGGGDPLSHPDFDRLVLTLKEKGLICNVTVNGRHLARHRAQLERLIEKEAIFGVGVSFYRSVPDWDYEHMVIHCIAGVDDPSHFELDRRLKLLILGYKQFGRGVNFEAKHGQAVKANIAQWYRELGWLAHAHHLSFDTLAISQLEPRRMFKSRDLYEMRYMGDEGQYSMYVDGVEQTYCLSSYSRERYDWTNIHDMFAAIRTGVTMTASPAS